MVNKFNGLCEWVRDVRLRFLSFPYVPFTQHEAAFSIVLIFGTPCEINRAPADVDRLLFRVVKMAWSEVDSLARRGGIVARTELVASFHACTHDSPWPSWRPRAVAACGVVRNMRGTPGQRGGGKAHDLGMFCSCTPEMYAPPMHALSPHVSRGYADQQNSQPVS
jgi:hypothetical protein